MTPAEMRVAQTRERLRQACAALAEPESAAAGRAGTAGKAASSTSSIPALLTSALHAWWARQAWRPVAGLLQQAIPALVQQVARRHPLRLVIGAGCVGAVLLLSKPWRWLPSPGALARRAARLLPAIAGTALTQVPVKSWLRAVSSLTHPPAGPTR